MKAITVRLDEEFWRRLKIVAVREGRSVQEIVGVLLEGYVVRREAGDLSAGDQPGLGAAPPASSPDVTERSGLRGPGGTVAQSASPRPAPAERSFRPDPKVKK